MFGSLTPISSAPSLFTFNGFGVTLYGRSDYDEESRSYATTYYFVGLFIPLFPIARYRVIDQGGRRYSFLGKLPLRKADRWHLGIAAAVIAVLLVGGISSSQNSSSSYSPSTSSTTSAYHPQNPQLDDIKRQIDSGRSRMATLDAKLIPVAAELNILNAQMAPLAADLKSLNAQQKSGTYIDVNNYNTKVDTYNTLLARRRALIAANNADFQTYEDLAKQNSVLVEQYNAAQR